VGPRTTSIAFCGGNAVGLGWFCSVELEAPGSVSVESSTKARYPAMGKVDAAL
jgi:hypothetical protein